MSAIRLSTPRRMANGLSTQLKPVAASRSRGFKLGRIVLVGFGVTQTLQLFLGIWVSQSAYDLKDLKIEKAELATQSQIVAQQVDSLSSQQNLANSASELGMIANANPVFLRIEDQKVFGKPKAALNTAGRVSRNSVASAALVERSVLTVSTAGVALANVAQAPGAGQPLAFSTETIPVSPTH